MNYLTSLRGVAALLVVLYHIKHFFSQYFSSELVNQVLSKCYLGVDFFFVLSGFILSYNYQKVFLFPKGSDYIVFLAKRVARIFPLHLVVMLAYLLIPLAYFVSGKPIPDYRFSFDLFFYKLFLVDQWLFSSRAWLSWNMPSWTISAEMTVYIFFPLLSLVSGRLKWLGTGFGVVFSAVILAWYYKHAGFSSIGDGIGTHGLVRCFCEFYIGVCVYRVLQMRGFAQSRYICFMGLTLSVFSFGLLTTVDGLPNYFFVPVLFGMILLFLVSCKTVFHEWLECRPLLFLGEISYSIYLIHIFVREVFAMFFLGNSLDASWIWVVSYIASVIILSIFTYRFIEMPARKAINAFFLKSKNA